MVNGEEACISSVSFVENFVLLHLTCGRGDKDRDVAFV